MINNLPIGLIVSAKDGGILQMNSLAQELLGVFDIPSGTRPIEVFSSPDLLAFLDGNEESCIIEGKERTIQFNALRKKDGKRWISLTDVTSVTKKFIWDFEVIDALASGIVTPLSVLTMESSFALEEGATDECLRSLALSAREAGVMVGDLLRILGGKLQAVEVVENEMNLDSFLQKIKRSLSYYEEIQISTVGDIQLLADPDLVSGAIRGMIEELRYRGAKDMRLRGSLRSGAVVIEAFGRIELGSYSRTKVGAGLKLTEIVAKMLDVPFQINEEAETLSLMIYLKSA